MIGLIIIGAGSRGTTYADLATRDPGRAEVVAVAEPRKDFRRRMADAHGIPPEHTANDWRRLLERPRFADAVVVATPDTLHLEPALAAAEKGYHILLEKPMDTTEQGCRQIHGAVDRAGVMMAVCHVLRYTKHTARIRQIIASGAIGEVVNIQRLEPVGYWHQAHSFVRGNWRRQDESSPMLLAKCCHDVDWISFIMAEQCELVQSFGTLLHFTPGNKPEDAAARCLRCACEPKCPYSAKKIYLQRFDEGHTGWPVDVLCAELTRENLEQALRQGQYGRCVYDCDNDVVDNQVMNMLFKGGQTATLTMTAFTEAGGRRTRVCGTRGELITDGSIIRHYDFLTDDWKEIDTGAGDHSIVGGHGGGDPGLMDAFMDAITAEDPSQILSGATETLESHMMVFAAERSRAENRVVAMEEMI